MSNASACNRRLSALTIAITLWILFPILPCRVAAQPITVPPLDESMAGRYYMIAFPDTIGNALDVRYLNNRVEPEVSVWIYSAVRNKVKLTSKEGWSQELTIEPGRFARKSFELGVVVRAHNTQLTKTFKIEAEYPVIVYCYMATIQGVEAWTPLPVEQWGTEYVAACVPGEVVSDIGKFGEEATVLPYTLKSSPAIIMVIAAYDNTSITILPPPGQGFLGNPPITVTLDEGEVYMVKSRVDTSLDPFDQGDISTSTIFTDKPVGVISGNPRSQVIHDESGLRNNVYKNMLIEWLAPAEQHGTEFVFMPTWDRHRPGYPNAKLERKREFVRIYSTQGKVTKGYALQGATSGEPPKNPFTIPADSKYEFALSAPTALYFKTEIPSQAMMHSSMTLYMESITPILRFSGLAPYMVSLTPREQWGSFAPYYVPTNPGLQHYMNVVTDTNSIGLISRKNESPFPFTQRIAGTDLIWGTLPLIAGDEGWLVGLQGAKFAGFVYGVTDGFERYMPGKTKKKDPRDATPASGGKGKAPKPLHPTIYEEINALSYGYPLAYQHLILRDGDSLWIDTLMGCTTLRIKIRTINANPVGLRSINLDPAETINARLVPVDPSRLSDIIRRSVAEVLVEPIDPQRDAEATVIIRDRSGKSWRVYYRYQAEKILIDPASILDFGEVTLDATDERTVTITNPLTRPLLVKEIQLAVGNRGFSIVKTEPDGPAQNPAVPVMLPPGGMMTVTIRVRPDVSMQDYRDTLKVAFGCITATLPITAVTAVPVIMVDDLNFGTFILGSDGPKKMTLSICNIGDGELSFGNPGDPDPTKLLTWPAGTNFSVDPAEIAKLQGITLRAGECYKGIEVTFTPQTVGFFRTTARVWGSVRKLRDTSVWTAIVVKPGVFLDGYDWKERWVTAKGTANCTKNDTLRYEAVIETRNVGNSPARVKEIVMPDADGLDGYFRFDSSDRRTTIMVGDEILPGTSRHQKVIFIPRDERPYFTRVLLITEPDDTVTSILEGIGIESHGSITGLTYKSAYFSGPYPATTAQLLTSVLRAKPTRPLTIRDVVIGGTHPNDFFIVNRAEIMNRTLQPDDTMHVHVEFRPQTNGDRTATIRFIGDHSICDDSMNVLSGYTYVRLVETRGYDFGIGCAADSGFVSITNAGTEPVDVRNATLTGQAGLFTLPGGIAPVLGTLAPGETRRLPVRFNRGAFPPGNYSATVSFTVLDKTFLAVEAAPVTITGSSYRHSVTAHVDGGPYRGAPGASITIPLMLDDDLSRDVPNAERVTSFRVKLMYDKQVVHSATRQPAQLAAMLEGTIVAGWNIVVVSQTDGMIELELTAPPGKYLAGPGLFMNWPIRLHLSTVMSSELKFEIELPGYPCLGVTTSPGQVMVDSICGLQYRLIELIGPHNYALDQNRPNPFNPQTKIPFTLGLDGRTRLTIYDAGGRKVATLLDGYMLPGKYQIEWNAEGFPSGLYYYRLESGDWTRTSTMVLRK